MKFVVHSVNVSTEICYSETLSNEKLNSTCNSPVRHTYTAFINMSSHSSANGTNWGHKAIANKEIEK